MSLRRPLVPLCVTAIASTALICFSPVFLLIPVVGVLVFGTVSIRKGGKKGVYASLCLVMLFLTVYPLIYEKFRAVKPIPYSEETQYCGTITELYRGAYTSVADVRLTEGTYRGENCRITIPNKIGVPSLFETIRFYGHVIPSKNAAESKAEEGRLYSDNVRLCATVVYDWKSVGSDSAKPMFRQRVYFLLRDRFSRLVDGDTQAMLLAVLLGDRSGLSTERAEAFRLSGLYPFLCISGVHIMLTAGLLQKALRKMRVPAFIRIPLLLTYLCAFAVVGGASGSVLRACFMAAIMWTAPIFSREYDSVSALCFSFLLLWIANPYMSYDLGTALSFVATLGVITANELQKDIPYPGMGKRLFPTLSASVYAVGFTSLLCIEKVGGVSLLAPFSNLFAGFVFAPAMSLSALTACLLLLPDISAITGFLKILASVCRILLRLFEGIAVAFAAVPCGYVELSLPSASVAVLFGACLSAVLFCLTFCGRKAQNAVSLAAALVPYGTVVVAAIADRISECF